MKATSIALDLAKGERAYVVPAVVGKRRANRVEALVLDHGLPADLTGCDVMFECMGDGWHAVAQCDVDGNRTSFDLPTFDRAGDVTTAYIRVAKEGAVRTTNDFTIRVLRKGAMPCSPFGSIWT